MGDKQFLHDPQVKGPGFQASGGARSEIVYESDRTCVLRVRAADGVASVIYKEPRGPDSLKRLRHETAMLERLAGVAGVARLAAESRVDAIALEDSGRRTLTEATSAARPSANTLVELAHGLARILDEVHRRGVVHGDINPANIVLSEEGRPSLIDFDLATTFSEERPGFAHPSAIVGTLSYLAPEQTGRTGRRVDQRADLYALGATLYAAATGRPPFESRDPLQLIHDHLARVPRPPIECNAALPQVLSDILLRLLEKDPDRRYQSADGLAHDLSRLRERMVQGEVGPFPLGSRDFPLRLLAPSRLIGREIEIGALRAAFENAQQGPGRGVLVTGAPGVGKTALLIELRPIVTAGGGWLVSGKFDQYRQDLDSDAVAQALQGLSRLLLAEPEAELTAQRAHILEALGANAGLMAATLPELATLLEVAPEAQADDPRNAGARLVQSALGILRAIASRARPVVVVLDDLQWASDAAISFVDAVLTDDRLQGVLLVGAYREAEVDVAHPLSAMLSRWERLGAAPLSLRLKNLPPAELSTLLEEMLRVSPSEAAQLAEVVCPRTGGNPYDSVELVNAFRRDGALVLGDAGWSWDAGTLRRHVGHDDVIQLLATRIDSLPGETVALLEIMACLGGEVELRLLQAASGVAAAELERQLAPALEDGLLVMGHDGPSAVEFRHDRVQQAAYGRQKPAARRLLHLTLARRLTALPELGALAAQQYLHVVEEVQDPRERRLVIGLFHGAAAHTRVINSVTSERFLAAAIGLLNGVLLHAEPTEADAALLVVLETARHAALYGLGRLDEADAVYRSIERRCLDPIDLAHAACVQVSSMANRGSNREAVDVGLTLLARLGVKVPGVTEFGAEVASRLDAFSRWVRASDRADDRGLSETNDPRVRLVAKLMHRLLAPAFFLNPTINTWLVLESQRLWEANGFCAPMVASLSAASSTTIALRQDYRTGYAAVRHALAVGEIHHYEPQTSFARFLMVMLARHWLEPLEQSAPQALLAREGLVRGGDPQVAGYTWHASLAGLLDCAPTVEASAAEAASGLAFAARTGNAQAAECTVAYRQLVRALRGETDAPGSFTDGSFDEGVHLGSVRKTPMAAGIYHVQRALGAALFGDSVALDRHAAAAMQLLPYMQGFYVVALAHLLRALALARRVKTAAPSERATLLAEIDACRDWLALRAADAPGNFSHLVTLVEAERAWAIDDFQAAASAFDAAQREVEPCQRPWHRAFIVERAARFHLAHGLEHAGWQLLGDARRCYDAWGASAKVNDLHREYPLLRGHRVSPRHDTAERSGAFSSDTIDLLAIVKASQALSSETHLDRLRARVVDVLGAMTGATAVRVLLWHGDARRWFLPPTADDEASMSVDEAGAPGLLPLSAFRYAARTLEPLLVEDATRDYRFARDPYLAGMGQCSLLIVPILSKGEPRAVLYLENGLSSSAFSADRLDAVMLIAGQLAVSLDNALAYASLEEHRKNLESTVATRTAELVVRNAAMRLVLDNVEQGLATVLADGTLDAERSGAFDRWFGEPPPRIHFAEHLAGGCGPTLRALQRAWGPVGAKPVEMLVDRTPTPIERDGAHFTVDFKPIVREGAVAGGLMMVSDVTAEVAARREQANLEIALRQAQKLEAVGRLASGIAHEINTPVQFVGDSLAFVREAVPVLLGLLEQYGAFRNAAATLMPPTAIARLSEAEDAADLPYLSEQLPRSLDDALGGLRRVAALVRGMKTFAHPDHSEMAMADLNDAIETTLTIASSEYRSVAEVQTEFGTLEPVTCHIGELNQVFINIIVNAAHAIGDVVSGSNAKGLIRIRTWQDGESAFVEIGDTGRGIPEAIRDKVFDPFFTTKEVGRGTGQGLAIAHSVVVEKHRGELTFQSEVGVGTTFRLRLPVRPPQPQNAG